ncbi:MAG: DUF533 domain-containing protein [Acidobacteria bacterium]|nr:DUF533 domain-containing protein [Acidobacteriota bacterium]
MGFLDRLVGDLIQDATGFNARRIVRRIGAGKLLMAGGAALAGALAVEKLGQQQPTPTPSGGTGQGPSHPIGGPPPAPPQAAPLPPLPTVPPPGASFTAPPPPPPHDGGVASAALPPPPELEPAEATEEELPPAALFAVVRTMVAAALADGELAAAEKKAITERLGESGLDEAQQRQIHQDLLLPPSPAELATMAPDAATRELLFRCAALLTRADGQLVPAEEAWLERLAEVFGLPTRRRDQILSEIADGGEA